MAAELIEYYLSGKNGPEKNEDTLVLRHGELYAVIDGATDKTGYQLPDGSTGGRWLSQYIAEYLRVLHVADMCMAECVDDLTKAIVLALAELGWPAQLPPPCASLVLYHAGLRQIWRVGDCPYGINGTFNLGGKLVDAENSASRAKVLHWYLAQGSSLEGLRAEDPGRAFILPALESQHLYANHPSHRLAYPVLNGQPIPAHVLEAPVDVPPGAEVILCSDGFDLPQTTLAATRAKQAEVYARDPLRIGIPEWGLPPSTKGIPAGATQHDDQAYVRLHT